MHPVFDTSIFPLHLPEASHLRNTLVQAYLNKADIEGFYRMCGPYVTVMPPLDLNKSPQDLWYEVLDKASLRLRLRNLCDAIKASGPIQPVLEAIQLLEELKPAVHPTVINLDYLVLDRRSLRSYLELLGDSRNLVRVVLVRGEKNSGKSYSRHLFEAMAQQQGSVPVVLRKGIVVTLDNVLGALFAEAGDINAKPNSPVLSSKDADETGTADSTHEAEYITICNTLLDTVQKKNKVVWIVMDDLGYIESTNDKGEKVLTSKMDSKIRAFFNQLVNQMARPLFRTHFRIMLINYPDGKLPTSWEQTHLKDEILKESDITQVHVEELINNWFVSKNEELMETQVQSIASDIISNVDNAPLVPDLPPRLERLRNEVLKIISQHQ
jgi:hypothetical protein